MLNQKGGGEMKINNMIISPNHWEYWGKYVVISLAICVGVILLVRFLYWIIKKKRRKKFFRKEWKNSD